MAFATVSDLVHERKRWGDMSNRRLFQRLQKITKPNKLAAFLQRAADEDRGTLFRDAVDRCNALGYTAIERSNSLWDVVEQPPSPFDNEPIPVRGPAGQVYEDSLRQLEEEITTTHPTIESTYESAKVEMAKRRGRKPEKKKKSLYSRKLRVKRRD